MEMALNAYRTWVDRSVKFGFYPASVGLALSEGGYSIVVTEELLSAYNSILSF